jgi:hypothetical protein
VGRSLLAAFVVILLSDFVDDATVSAIILPPVPAPVSIGIAV